MIERGFSKPTERVTRLKDAILNAVPYVESERAVLTTEVYKATEGMPNILRRAKLIEKLLNELPVTIRDGELIVGALTKHPRSTPICPEFSCAWVEQEFGTMATRAADKFEIPSETARELHEAFLYWPGKTISDLAASYMSKETKDAIANSVFTVGNYFYGGVGHVSVDYEKVLKHGFRGIITEAVVALEKLDRLDPSYIKKQQFYNALIITYNAAIAFARRYADKARELAKAERDPVRRTELTRIAENCARVPENGASTFWEALQSFWFVQLIVQIESSGHSISPGRFDQYVWPFFAADKSISGDFAQELLDALWVKFNDVNKTRDEVSAQAFGGYPMFQNLIVGGQTEDGIDATNELSYMCMEATAHTLLPQPSLSIRYWNGTPDEFLYRASEVARLGLGVPAMYNDEVIIPAIQNRGVSLADARNYAIIGCVEPQCPGKTEGWHDAAFFNVAKVVEITLNNGRVGNLQLGPKTGELVDFRSIDELWAAFEKQMAYFVFLLTEGDNCVDLAHGERGQLPFLSALVEDCIGRGKSVQEGGAVYNFTGPQAVGVADAGDSIYAIQKHVFEDKKITLVELKKAIDANFGVAVGGSVAANVDPTEDEVLAAVRRVLSANNSVDVRLLRDEVKKSLSSNGAVSSDYSAIHRLLDSTPSFGNDIDEVDLAARRAALIYCREVEKYRNPRGGQFQAGMYPVSANVLFGNDVGALPDGRLAKAPLADGVSPRQGKDVKGPSAAANSVAKLDHFIASNGTLYNMKFLPSALAGGAGLKNFAALVRSYFDHKGMHVQFNVIDRKTLLDAQREPEKHKNLVVRVAGYSAQFVSLSKDLQDDIINRTEQAF